ncbi:MAG: hypothetical protein HYZ73_07140, partial [Elusimicrobia bacterium]|nr:hypothetical protein [Elusimicrobiota bacterium]
ELGQIWQGLLTSKQPLGWLGPRLREALGLKASTPVLMVITELDETTGQLRTLSQWNGVPRDEAAILQLLPVSPSEASQTPVIVLTYTSHGELLDLRVEVRTSEQVRTLLPRLLKEELSPEPLPDPLYHKGLSVSRELVDFQYVYVAPDKRSKGLGDEAFAPLVPFQDAIAGMAIRGWEIKSLIALKLFGSYFGGRLDASSGSLSRNQANVWYAKWLAELDQLGMAAPDDLKNYQRSLKKQGWIDLNQAIEATMMKDPELPALLAEIQQERPAVQRMSIALYLAMRYLKLGKEDGPRRYTEFVTSLGDFPSIVGRIPQAGKDTGPDDHPLTVTQRKDMAPPMGTIEPSARQATANVVTAPSRALLWVFRAVHRSGLGALGIPMVSQGGLAIRGVPSVVLSPEIVQQMAKGTSLSTSRSGEQLLTFTMVQSTDGGIIVQGLEMVEEVLQVVDGSSMELVEQLAEEIHTLQERKAPRGAWIDLRDRYVRQGVLPSDVPAHVVIQQLMKVKALALDRDTLIAINGVISGLRTFEREGVTVIQGAGHTHGPGMDRLPTILDALEATRFPGKAKGWIMILYENGHPGQRQFLLAKVGDLPEGVRPTTLSLAALDKMLDTPVTIYDLGPGHQEPQVEHRTLGQLPGAQGLRFQKGATLAQLLNQLDRPTRQALVEALGMSWDDLEQETASIRNDPSLLMGPELVQPLVKRLGQPGTNLMLDLLGRQDIQWAQLRADWWRGVLNERFSVPPELFKPQIIGLDFFSWVEERDGQMILTERGVKRLQWLLGQVGRRSGDQPLSYHKLLILDKDLTTTELKALVWQTITGMRERLGETEYAPLWSEFQAAVDDTFIVGRDRLKTLPSKLMGFSLVLYADPARQTEFVGVMKALLGQGARELRGQEALWLIGMAEQLGEEPMAHTLRTIWDHRHVIEFRPLLLGVEAAATAGKALLVINRAA